MDEVISEVIPSENKCIVLKFYHLYPDLSILMVLKCGKKSKIILNQASVMLGSPAY